MTEIWEWDSLYRIEKSCLGAVKSYSNGSYSRSTTWFFIPYQLYKTRAVSNEWGPYASEKDVKEALSDWNKRVQHFILVLVNLNEIYI